MAFTQLVVLHRKRKRPFVSSCSPALGTAGTGAGGARGATSPISLLWAATFGLDQEHCTGDLILYSVWTGSLLRFNEKDIFFFVMVVLCQDSSKPYSWCCNNSICAGEEKRKQIKCFTASMYCRWPSLQAQKSLKNGSLGFLSLIANGNFLQSNRFSPAGPVNPPSVTCMPVSVLALSLWKEHW